MVKIGIRLVCLKRSKMSLMILSLLLNGSFKINTLNPLNWPFKGGVMGGCWSLLGAVVGQVPLTDMLRYHHFTVGRYWIPEYGNPEENPEHFRFIYAYSPLHNLKQGVKYPPMMLLTADHDDRVVPAHAEKFVATLQNLAQGNSQNPYLLRIETRAGHGAGKPTQKIIEEQSDIFTFLYQTLKMNP